MAESRVVLSVYLISVENVSSVRSSSLSFFITNSRKTLKNVVDRRQPCLRPMCTLKHSVSWSTIPTANSVLLYSSSTIRTIFGSMPMAKSNFHIAFLQIVSKAVLKYTKLK